MRIIDYYLFGQSPYTYLGHRALKDMADRRGARVRLKPIHLHDLWANSGAAPTLDRPPVRQRYEEIEFRRIALERGLSLTLHPAHFPINIALADRCAIAIVEQGDDAFDYVEAVGKGVWQDDADMSVEAEIVARLSATGHDAQAILEQARTDEIEVIRRQNTKDAIAANAVGVPAYVLDGEVFFGQDRISMLERALTSGRAPILNPAT